MALLTFDPAFHPTARPREPRSYPSFRVTQEVWSKNSGEFGNLEEAWFEPSIGFAPYTAPSMSGVRLPAMPGHVNMPRDPCCPAQSPPFRLRAARSWNACCESSEGVFIAAFG